MRKCVPFTVPKDGFQGEQIPLWLSPVFQIFFFSPLSIVGCFVNSISQLLNRFLWNSDGVWVSHDETCIYVAGIHELVKSDANPTSGDIKVDFFFRKIRTL